MRNSRNYSNLLRLIVLVTLTVTTSHANGQSCSFPGSPAHGLVTFSDENLGNGAVASYTCERGFELLGPARRVCDQGNWTPEGIPFCVLNVAAGKAPMQISTEGAGIPQKAIDGSTSSFFQADTCSLTKPEKSPWWYVNLLEPYMVQLVRLDFGKPCCGKNKPATIVIRVGNNRPDLGINPICNRFTGLIEEGQPLFLPCNPPMPGAFVSVHLEGPGPSALSICEAFVYTDQALPIERCPVFRDQPPGASASYNGKCYVFYNRQPLNFREALGFCRSRGGTLINESNPALQGFISWELWRRHRSDVNSQYWMGAVRDAKDRNTWRWLGGEEVTVSFWNLPGGNEDCSRYDGSKGWLWSDTNCQTPLNFICQHQPKACGRPEQPPNSTMIAPNSYDVGATVDYSCDEGHLLVGPSSRTCLDTGFYNEFPPVCKFIECGLPASIPHGAYDLVNGTVGYLSTVIYKCNEGYEMLGRAMLTCDIDERWNGPPPRCELIECEALPASVQNAKILTPNGTTFGSQAEILCPTGYEADGPNQIDCLANGQWSDPIPVCIPVDQEDSGDDLTTEEPAVTQYRPRPTSGRPPVPPRTPTKFTTPTPPIVSSTGAAVSSSTNKINVIVEPDSEDNVNNEILHPGNVNVREEVPILPRRPSRPSTLPPKNGHANNYTPGSVSVVPEITPPPSTPPKVIPLHPNGDNNFYNTPTTKDPLAIINAAHPQDNQIAGSVNIRTDQSPNVNIPQSVDNDQQQPHGARLNLGAIIALGAFGGFVFLAAIITTIVVLVRSCDPPRTRPKMQQRLPSSTTTTSSSSSYYLSAPSPPSMASRSGTEGKKKRPGNEDDRLPSRGRTTQHYRHRASPDCNTVASFDSSSSESRNGLNRYYRQAWENLHESASKNSNHTPLRRKETMDQPNISRSRDNLSRSRDNLDRSTRDMDRSRDFGRDTMGMRDGSEMVVSDVCVKGEKKRHHHHHHKSSHRNGGGGGAGDFREPNYVGNSRRENRQNNSHY